MQSLQHWWGWGWVEKRKKKKKKREQGMMMRWREGESSFVAGPREQRLLALHKSFFYIKKHLGKHGVLGEGGGRGITQLLFILDDVRLHPQFKFLLLLLLLLLSFPSSCARPDFQARVVHALLSPFFTLHPPCVLCLVCLGIIKGGRNLKRKSGAN